MSKSTYTLINTVYAEFNILYIYYRYIVKSVYGDIVISVQYIRIYTMYIYYQYITIYTVYTFDYTD